MSTLVTTNLKNPSNPENNLVLEADGSVVFAPGTAANPVVTFTGDTGTGIYSPGTGQVAIATGGVQRLLISSDGSITPASPLRFPAGSAGSPSISFTGDTNTGIYSPGADQVAISTGGAGRLFVRSGGLIEINPSATEANSRRLLVRGSEAADGAVLLKSNSTPDGNTRGFLLQSFGASSDAYVWQQENSPLVLGTNATERLRITSAGLVGIGTSSPTDSLLAITVPAPGLSGDATLAGGQTTATNSFRSFEWGLRVTGEASPSLNGRAAIQFRTDPGTGGSDSSIRFVTNKYGISRAERMIITSTGNVGIGTTSPGYPLHIKVDQAATTNIAVENTSSGSGAYAQFRVAGDNGGGYFGYAGSGSGGTGLYEADYVYLVSENNASGLNLGAASGPLRFFSQNSERGRFDASGRLLVGTSSALSTIPGQATPRLHLAGGTDGGIAVATFRADEYASNIEFRKSRSSSVGTNTIVQNGDTLGKFYYCGADGANFIAAAEIRGEVDGTPGTNDMPGRLVFSTTADGASSPTERLRIDSAGQIEAGSLGTAAAPVWTFLSDPNTGIYSPGADQVAISTAGSPQLFVNTGGKVSIGGTTEAVFGTNSLAVGQPLAGRTGGLTIYSGPGQKGYINFANGTAGTESYRGLFEYDHATNNLGIFTNATERLRITSAGLVGVGTSSPSERLDLGGGVFDTVKIRFTMGGNVGSIGSVGSGAATGLGNLTFFTRNGSSEVAAMTIDGSQRVGIGTASPGQPLEVLGTIYSQNNATTIVHFQAADTGAATDEKTWRVAQTFRSTKALGLGVAVNDASSIANAPILIVRNGAGIDNIQFATSASERARIDSSGRLLVGTSTAPTVGVPASATFVVQGYAGVPTGDSLISLQRGQAPASISSGAQLGAITFGANDGSPYAQIHAATDGTGGTNDYPGRLVFSTTADGASSPSERMRIDSTGLVTLTGPGIKFPATQVASADPNTLDDYEEGTFTPVLNGVSSVGTGTYTLQQGRYTKIGRTVSIDIVLTWTAHTGTGTMFLTGIPFSFGIGFGYRAPLSINTTGVSATVAYGDGAYGNISVPTTIASSGTIYINGTYTI